MGQKSDPVNLHIIVEVLEVVLRHHVRSDPKFAKLKGLSDLCAKLVETNKCNTFAMVYKLFKLALLLPVATASVELKGENGEQCFDMRLLSPPATVLPTPTAPAFVLLRFEIWVQFGSLFISFMIRDVVVEDFWPILMWFGFINPRGYGYVNSEGSGLLRSAGFKSSCIPTLVFMLERAVMFDVLCRELLALGF
ncbi:hypothetical protein MTR_4g011480 [Medicago truncatula]|uniref:Uncharacterized protein n=1 Tax=Medicago truncatula TaxID=3880 RepID=A0A072UHY0_MEDTR|nr:hypothetical protein MTR_4g011480 [Medicago truncatula]